MEFDTFSRQIGYLKVSFKSTTSSSSREYQQVLYIDWAYDHMMGNYFQCLNTRNAIILASTMTVD